MDDERRGKISKIKLSSEKIDPVPAGGFFRHSYPEGLPGLVKN
jgi:hypothetical protein